jgi:hypothetical protein
VGLKGQNLVRGIKTGLSVFIPYLSLHIHRGNTSLMPDKRKRRNTPAKVLDHVFIDQRPESLQPDHSRLVSSQARRFQSAGKRQQQRLSANQDAGYARSLVGWRSASSTPSAEGRRLSVSPLKSKSPEQRQATTELDQGERSEARISLAIRTGPRADPFSAFPSSNTKTVMLQVDYCMSSYLHHDLWSIPC